MPYYLVTLRHQHPAWDELGGIEYRIQARTRADAIKRARRRAHDAGHVSSVTGRATFTARLDDSQAADMDAYA